MTQQPFSNAALRGAVDLSGLGKPPAAGRPAGAAPAGPGASENLTQASDATFEAVVKGSTTVPTVLVLWSAQAPESLPHAEALAGLSRDYEGRFVVVGVDLGANPSIMQALTPVLQQTFGQIDALPVVLGLVQGQPMPFYLGVQDVAQLRPLFDQFLEAATQNGVTGRADVVSEEPVEDAEAERELPPLHQSAFEAIERGDLDAARSAYQQALTQDPGDADARLGLGQVELLARTQSLDAAATRAAAAQRPGDVATQIAAADLDVVGGHVEDAFARLVETVRVTAGDERDQVREHLLSLFEVVGTQDPRVATARRALTTALF